MSSRNFWRESSELIVALVPAVADQLRAHFADVPALFYWMGNSVLVRETTEPFYVYFNVFLCEDVFVVHRGDRRAGEHFCFSVSLADPEWWERLCMAVRNGLRACGVRS